MGADGKVVPELQVTPRAEAMLDSIAPANTSVVDRADAHRLAKTTKQEVVAKGGHEVVWFDGASAVPRRGRRDSLSAVLEGNDDEFSTREGLAQRIAMSSASLGAKIKENRGSGVFAQVCRRLWMPIVMLALGNAMLALPLHALFTSSPNAWTEEGEGEWEGDDEGSPVAELVQRFEANEPIGAFLGVTALVYALIFAAAYSEAHSRLDEIRTSLTLGLSPSPSSLCSVPPCPSLFLFLPLALAPSLSLSLSLSLSPSLSLSLSLSVSLLTASLSLF